MPDILHTRHIGAAPDTIWPLLTTVAGLETWWTIGKTQVTGDPIGAAPFRFASGSVMTELVTESIAAPSHLTWRCAASNAPGGWIGTLITFDLAAEGRSSRLEFAHRGFVEESEGFRRVTAGWSQYLDQLKTAAESVQS